MIFAGASLLTLGSIGFALKFYRNVLGLLLYNEQFLAGMVDEKVLTSAQIRRLARKVKDRK